MKKEIATLFLMTSVWAAQAQGTFTIEGQVKNVEDGALITLFRLDGNVGSSIGVDTIRNGHFRFQAETLGNETEIVDMMGRSDKFPSMSLRLWVRPGDNIRISGENTLIRTWDCLLYTSIEMNHRSKYRYCFPLHFRSIVRSFHASLYFQIIVDFHFHDYTVVALWIHRIHISVQRVLFAKA